MSDPHRDEAAAFSVRGVKKSYRLPDGRALPVLRGVDLDVRPGEFVLVEGRSGIGKSTLLHIMGLLDRPDAGEVILDGRDYARATKRARARARAARIGFVFQFFHLLPEFTALENVMMTGKVRDGIFAWRRRAQEARDRAQALLEQVGIGARSGHRPNQLSGGERQRVALARALFSEPALLLCDEPTGNLDVRTSEEIHDLLVELNRTTRQTMVVVTHDPGLSLRASRTIRIFEGRAEVVAEGGVPVESGEPAVERTPAEGDAPGEDAAG
ncbi:MAG: ABC transporter ATP-binding protein [Planctomycetota bacterium]